MSSDIEDLIFVLSKGYYPKIEQNKIHDEIKKYYICRLETYISNNNSENSENLAMVDTVDYFSKQKRIKWNLN